MSGWMMVFNIGSKNVSGKYAKRDQMERHKTRGWRCERLLFGFTCFYRDLVAARTPGPEIRPTISGLEVPMVDFGLTWFYQPNLGLPP
jgi:hypothetical protein